MRKVDCGNGVVLYAVNGYHWYRHEPTGTWMRSVTRLTKHYPAGEGLDRWKCSFPNYDMMKDALREAGIRGSAVHEGVVDLVEGRGLKRSQFSPEQWKHLQSFVRWHEDMKPDIHFTEEVVFSLRRKLAGTLDIRATIDGLHTIVDIKTSSAIYRNHVIQAQAMLFCSTKGTKIRSRKWPCSEPDHATNAATSIRRTISVLGLRRFLPVSTSLITIWTIPRSRTFRRNLRQS